uniref:Trafficking protein particle complex subunit 6B n=1 Tax=Arcella intermedia TaxID=1963864 RepID=A0A6B2LNY0_9EUKA
MELVQYFFSTATTEAANYKLEKLGIRVGQKLAERYTKDRPRFNEKIDIIKFICKDFWIELFKKQIDNLRTNHKGVYVLTDSKFRWIVRLSTDTNQNTKTEAEKYVVFPCGIIKGALESLGVQCVVKAEIGTFPACSFTIKIS